MKNKLSIHKGKLLAWLLIVLAIILTHFSDSILNEYFNKNLEQPTNEEFISVTISKPNQEESFSQKIDLDKMDIVETETQANIIDPEEEPKAILPAPKKANKFSQDLIIVHYLISKFLQNLDYSQELNRLDRSFLPKNINDLLNRMEDYEKKHLATVANKDVLSKNSNLDRIIGRFIKIEKDTDEITQQKKLYESIKKDLHILEDYFYSEQSLDRLSSI